MSWFITPYGSNQVTEGGYVTFQISRNHYGNETVYFSTFQDYGPNDSDYVGHGGDQLSFSYYDTSPRYITVQTLTDQVAN